MRKVFNRYLFSFALSTSAGFLPLIILWKSNLGQIPQSAVWNNLISTSLYVLIVFIAWLLIVRSPEKTAILSSITSLFIFSYGHIYNLIGQKTVLGLHIGPLKLALPWGLLFIALCFYFIRTKQKMNLVYLLPIGLLLLVNLVPILSFLLDTQRPSSQPDLLGASRQTKTSDLPDIYYIILDAYARDDILEEVIGYDNTEFLRGLKERGFYIPNCAFSNYDGTFLTVASVLNYDFADHLGIPINGGKIKASDLNLIQQNQAAKTFRSLGYEFVTGRGYAAFNDIQSSDIYLNYALDQDSSDDLAQKRFTSLYLNTTVFRIISELYKITPEKFRALPAWLAINNESDPSLIEANFWYQQNNFMFAELEKFPERTGNYFVYAHINAPHGPYVYRSNGAFRYPLDDQDEKIRYADAITYINKRVLEVVDILQKKSSPAPIIIIQGDHGIHGMTTGLDKHKILSAYYLPGKLSTPLYNTITPVNNFRLILRNYFDSPIALLPDTLWVKFTNDHEPVLSSCDLVH